MAMAQRKGRYKLEFIGVKQSRGKTIRVQCAWLQLIPVEQAVSSKTHANFTGLIRHHELLRAFIRFRFDRVFFRFLANEAMYL